MDNLKQILMRPFGAFIQVGQVSQVPLHYFLSKWESTTFSKN